jgi:hypothetical protein
MSGWSGAIAGMVAGFVLKFAGLTGFDFVAAMALGALGISSVAFPAVHSEIT